MMDLIFVYFVFGSGMYIGMSLNNPMSFLDATAGGLIRGFLLCFLFWPVGFTVKLFEILLVTGEFKIKKKKRR